MKRLWLSALLAVVSVVGASAEDYPNRPITVIVPFPAGGPTDAIIRNLGERMRVSLGQPLIVEYVTGAGGTVGTTRANRAAPDGYTIICGHFGTHATNGAVYQLPYDLVTDFTPISLLPRNPYLIVAQKNLPPGNLREFMAYLKANPGKVNMGHPGAGTIKASAIAAPARANSAPDVPTVAEAGAPGLHMSLWYGFWAPPGTPAPIVNKLKAAVHDALADPEVRTRLSSLGMEIPPREQQTAEALVAQQKADIEFWWPIIRAAGIKQQ